jgi:hypothetical protein
MEIRLLTINDFEQIERIYFDSFWADRKKKELRGIEVEQDFEFIQKKDDRWFENAKNLYLNEEDTNHLMWGAFEEQRLVVFFCVRLNLPGAWDDGFVISWMRGDPTVNNMTNGSLGKMYKIVYDHCEAIGKKRWYWIVEQDRYRKFNAFAKRYTSFIDDRYEPYLLCDIPRNTKPGVDWVWSMIGRTMATHEDYTVRAGILKEEHVLETTKS